MNPTRWAIDELGTPEGSPRWEAWELVVEGFCPVAHEGGRRRLRQIDTSTGRWGYCDLCHDGWRASSGGFTEADGTPYGRTIEVHHVVDGSEKVTLQVDQGNGVSWTGVARVIEIGQARR